jgi:hypothetical protein
MKKTIVVACLLSINVMGQYQSGFEHSVMSNYYESSFGDSSKQVLSSKIYYPGQYKDTVSTIAAGFNNDQLLYDKMCYDNSTYNLYDSRGSLKLSHFYSWLQYSCKFGNFGGFVGGIDFVNQDESELVGVNKIKDETEKFQGNGAVWYTPPQNPVFKGLSLTIKYAKNDEKDNYVENNNSISKHEDAEFVKNVNTNLNSLFRLTENLDLRLVGGMSTSKHEQREYSQSEIINYYYGNYGVRTPHIVKFEENEMRKTEYKGYNFSSSLIFGKRHEFALFGNINKYQFEYDNVKYNITSNQLPLSISNLDITSGHCMAGISYSSAKKFNYKKHSAYAGVNIYSGVNFFIENLAKNNWKEIIKEADKDQSLAFGAVVLPFTIDINLFNSEIYAVAKVVPSVYGSYHKNKKDDGNYKKQDIECAVDEYGLGLRGKLGDNFEFMLVPSIRSKVFLTGLEMQYHF